MTQAIKRAIDVSERLEYERGEKKIRFPPRLKEMIEALRDALRGNADAARICRAWLAETLASADALAPGVRWPSAQTEYDRLTLFADARRNVTVMAIVWPERTSSPVHSHRAWCAFGACVGTLTERTYQNAHDGAPAAHAYEPGAVGFDDSCGKYCHRLSNDSPEVAVSLHVYGLAPDKLHTINRVMQDVH
ncbi:MAG: cysteine dioxygenase family protein [Rickettsiales bacterium]